MPGNVERVERLLTVGRSGRIVAALAGAAGLLVGSGSSAASPRFVLMIILATVVGMRGVLTP